MTIGEAESLLVSFFVKNDCFDMEKNFKEVVLISLEQDKEQAILLAALSNLELAKILKKVSKGDKDFFVLVKPLESYSQNIELTFPTIVAITEVVNNACEALKDKKNLVDILNIKERDIQNLVLLAANKNEGKS